MLGLENLVPLTCETNTLINPLGHIVLWKLSEIFLSFAGQILVIWNIQA